MCLGKVDAMSSFSLISEHLVFVGGKEGGGFVCVWVNESANINYYNRKLSFKSEAFL